MYAIVEIAGLQYRVEKDQQLLVHRLEGQEGDKVSFDKVMLTDDGTVNVGAPVIEGLAVEAKILEHLKGDKVIVFKKKRRKGYRKKNGHRQYLSKIEIVSIGKGSAKVKKEKAPAKAAEKVATKETKKKTAQSKAKAAKKTEVSAKDNLKLIEGIGPKAEEILNIAGVTTFADLAKKSAEEIKETLTAASSRMNMLDPTSWAKQAELVRDGKMDELKAWQDELKGGKETK